MEPHDLILVMGSIHRVLKAEKILLGAGIDVDTLVTPRSISADCGMVVTAAWADREGILALLKEAGYEPAELWRRAGEEIEPADIGIGNREGSSA